MATRPTSNAPQPRGHDISQKLLQATLKALAESGLDGTTVPRIAGLAGVAPTSIYRSFVDKDSLLRAAFLDLLSQSNESNRNHLKALVVKDTLFDTTRHLMGVLLRPYRDHPLLTLAMKQFFAKEKDDDVLRKALDAAQHNILVVEAALLTHRDEIRHPNPERAVRFAIVSALATIESLTIDARWTRQIVNEMSDTELIEELARSCVAYLQR